MLGRFLALIVGAAMGAAALYLYQPTIYGPEVVGLSFGDYETFRPLAIFCTAGLALCGLMAAFGPPERKAKPAASAVSAPSEESAPMTAETSLDPEPDAFRIGSSPAVSPLW